MSITPRRQQINLASKLLSNEKSDIDPLINTLQPMTILLQATQEINGIDSDDLFEVSKFFTRMELFKNTKLFDIDDISDGFYLVESGLLKASRRTKDGTYSGKFTESILPGTFIGEVTFLTNINRLNAVQIFSETAVVWKFVNDKMDYRIQSVLLKIALFQTLLQH